MLLIEELYKTLLITDLRTFRWTVQTRTVKEYMYLYISDGGTNSKPCTNAGAVLYTQLLSDNEEWSIICLVNMSHSQGLCKTPNVKLLTLAVKNFDDVSC